MVAYMKSFEIEQMWINKGIEQGISQGIAQGISQGITQGIEQGRSEEWANTLREKARADRLERELRKLRSWEMMLFGFGRVPGCLGLGALFLCG